MEKSRLVMRGKTKRLFATLFFISILISLANIFLLLPENIQDLLIPNFLAQKTIHINRNYFLDVRSFANNELLIDEGNCKIPKIDPWDPSVMPFMNLPILKENCRKTHFHWTYTDNTAIVINESDIIESGYLAEDIICCYHIIMRKEQDAIDYDKDADNLIFYSEDCIDMENVTTPQEGEFFKVSCTTNSWTGRLRTLYTHYHSIPNPVDNVDGVRNIKKVKADYWKKYLQNETKEIPPNLIFVGLDSTSRINIHRNMLKTVKALNDIGAIEMFGYTKVGFNTFPNFAALLNGYSEDELTDICHPSEDAKLDDCPFIWKRLDAANYYTAQIEDRPAFTGFNYLKTGFVQQPVDFYLRTLFLAAHDNSPDILNRLHVVKNDRLDCIGYKTNDEMMVDYIDSLWEMSDKSRVPLFSLSWSTTLTHDVLNNCQLVDELYADLILSTQRRSRSNTIFIFLSDHGYRYGAFRETLSGWYEEKLPALWIYLPPSVKKRFPKWEESLMSNSRRLTSPFHLHWTINHILNEFTDSNALVDARNATSGEVIAKRFQNSLLVPVPDNWTCEDVGVPETFCACYPLEEVDSSDENLEKAAENAIASVNLFLPEESCAVLRVKKVIGGTLLDKTAHKTNSRITYIVSFTSQPGDFLFEADIDFYPHTNLFSRQPNVLRTSKINTDVSCVRNPLWEQYCFCKSLQD